jgi:hypothetical protein
VLFVVGIVISASAAGILLELVVVFALLLASVWVAVQVARANTLGGSLRVSPDTFPELQAVLDDVRETLGYERRIEVFVADKPGAPISTLNYLGTRIMVMEGSLVGGLLADGKTDQLTFLIGRDIGALKARLTRLDVFVALLNAVNALRLMAPFLLPYYRATTYSGDQIGMACAGRLEPALEATRRLLVGEKLAPALEAGVVIPQAALVRRRLLPRFGQLFVAEPHITNRYGNLLCFSRYSDPAAWERVAETMTPAESSAFEELWERSPYSRRVPATTSRLRRAPRTAPTSAVAENDPRAEAPAVRPKPGRRRAAPPRAPVPHSSLRAVLIAVIATALVVAAIAGALLVARSGDSDSPSIVDTPAGVGTTPSVDASASGVSEPRVQEEDLPALMPTADELGPSFGHLTLDDEYWLPNSKVASDPPERGSLVEDSGRVTGYNAEFSLAEGEQLSEPTSIVLSLDLFDDVGGASSFLTGETEFAMADSVDDESHTLVDTSAWYPVDLGEESTGFVQTYDFVDAEGYESTLYYVTVGFRSDVVVGWAYGWFGQDTTTELRERLITQAAERLLDKVATYSA